MHMTVVWEFGAVSASREADALTKNWCIHDDVVKWKHFRVTGPLCREFTGHRWIPLTKASDAEFWCFFLFFWVWTKGWVNNRDAGDLRRRCAHYDVTVMSSEDWHGDYISGRQPCRKRIKGANVAKFMKCQSSEVPKIWPSRPLRKYDFDKISLQM